MKFFFLFLSVFLLSLPNVEAVDYKCYLPNDAKPVTSFSSVGLNEYQIAAQCHKDNPQCPDPSSMVKNKNRLSPEERKKVCTSSSPK